VELLKEISEGEKGMLTSRAAARQQVVARTAARSQVAVCRLTVVWGSVAFTLPRSGLV
jgi:hypothetical protein